MHVAQNAPRDVAELFVATRGEAELGARDAGLRDVCAAAGLGELFAVEDREVDGLLPIHVDAEIRTQHVVDDLDVERRRPERLEVGSIETHALESETMDGPGEEDVFQCRFLAADSQRPWRS